ncbi:MAG: methyltransferase domain-containing protein [Thermoplasmata archaeon]
MTRSAALRVDRTRGEEIRAQLAASGALRTELAIRREGQYLVFPVLPSAMPDPAWGEWIEAEFELLVKSSVRSYRDLLPWTEADARFLPRSFDVVGDIVLVRVPEELRSRSAEIGDALRRFVPGARLVGADFGVHGETRRRRLVAISGSGSWRTRHRENGIEIEVEVDRAYFSPRLAREHERVATEVRAGDRVFDLCCGVGPFSLTIAKEARSRKIVAVDANPAAIELLEATRARYPFAQRIEPRLERFEEFLSGGELAERVIFNLPHEGIKYLPSVAQAVAPGGRLYYYELVAREDAGRRKEQIVQQTHSPGDWTVATVHTVHPYSPRADIMAFTLQRAPE